MSIRTEKCPTCRKRGQMMKFTKCQGEGQGSCKRCTENGKWNRMWMCFLYKIDGYEGCYCHDCLKEIQDKERTNDEQAD